MADITLPPLRVDGAGYPEGVQTAGFIINKSILSKTLWIPNVTYTPADLNDAGTMLFPTVEKVTNGEETELCADGVAGTVKGGYETLQVTSKVSAEFHGCFNVAGIADGKFSKAQNNLKMKVMAEDFNLAIYNRALVAATESAIEAWAGTAGDGSAYTYMKARRREFKDLNGSYPDFAFINEDFYDALEADFEKRQTNLGDSTIMSGIGSEMDTFEWRRTTFIANTQDEDLVFGSKETNYIATPSSAKQLATFMGDISYEGLESGFTKGLLSVTAVGNHMNPASVKTGVHKAYGHAAVAKITFTKPKAVEVPAGGTTATKTTKESTK